MKKTSNSITFFCLITFGLGLYPAQSHAFGISDREAGICKGERYFFYFTCHPNGEVSFPNTVGSLLRGKDTPLCSQIKAECEAVSKGK